MNAEGTSRIGLVSSGSVVVLLLAPGALDVTPAASGVAKQHGSPTVVTCPCAVDPEDQDREPGQDLAAAGVRVDSDAVGPARGRPEPASPTIRPSGRPLFMVAPKQGPPAPPLV